jgi:mannosyltransferase
MEVIKEESTDLRHRLAALSPPVVSLVVLTILAMILRSLFLSAKSLWLDEAWSSYRASVPLSVLFQQVIGEGNINMGLYHFFMHWWVDVFGTSEISLRAPSVIFASATVPLVYAIGRELFDSETGLLAALLMAVNVSCIQFAQQARAYALIGMMVTLATLLFLRTMKDPSGKRCAGYTILGGTCAWVHLFGFLVFPAHFISLFVFPADRKTRIRLVTCLVIIGALSVVPIGLAITRQHGQVNWIGPTNIMKVISLFAMFAGLHWGAVHRAGLILFGAYLATIGIAVVGYWRRERAAIVLLLSLVLLPVAIAIGVSFFKHLFVPRYLLICVPFFLLLAAAGLRQIRPRPLMASLAALMVVLCLLQDRNFYYGPSQEEWRGAVALVANESKPGDVLIVFPPWNSHPAEYYLDRLEPPREFRVVVTGIKPLRKTAQYADARNALVQFLHAQNIAPLNRIWILTDEKHGRDPDFTWMFDGHRVAGPQRLPGVSLFLF